ncbi:hypothetical protein HK405_010380 [Cladochytrium tenue]|nr:hypothetical protein HK405_010380 [Cladochytrium tenue]
MLGSSASLFDPVGSSAPSSSLLDDILGTFDSLAATTSSSWDASPPAVALTAASPVPPERTNRTRPSAISSPTPYSDASGAAAVKVFRLGASSSSPALANSSSAAENADNSIAPHEVLRFMRASQQAPATSSSPYRTTGLSPLNMQGRSPSPYGTTSASNHTKAVSPQKTPTPLKYNRAQRMAVQKDESDSTGDYYGLRSRQEPDEVEAEKRRQFELKKAIMAEQLENAKKFIKPRSYSRDASPVARALSPGRQQRDDPRSQSLDLGDRAVAGRRGRSRRDQRVRPPADGSSQSDSTESDDSSSAHPAAMAATKGKAITPNSSVRHDPRHTHHLKHSDLRPSNSLTDLYRAPSAGSRAPSAAASHGVRSPNPVSPLPYSAFQHPSTLAAPHQHHHHHQPHSPRSADIDEDEPLAARAVPTATSSGGSGSSSSHAAANTHHQRHRNHHHHDRHPQHHGGASLSPPLAADGIPLRRTGSVNSARPSPPAGPPASPGAASPVASPAVTAARLLSGSRTASSPSLRGSSGASAAPVSAAAVDAPPAVIAAAASAAAAAFSSLPPEQQRQFMLNYFAQVAASPPSVRGSSGGPPQQQQQQQQNAFLAAIAQQQQAELAALRGPDGSDDKKKDKKKKRSKKKEDAAATEAEVEVPPADAAEATGAAAPAVVAPDAAEAARA